MTLPQHPAAGFHRASSNDNAFTIVYRDAAALAEVLDDARTLAVFRFARGSAAAQGGDRPDAADLDAARLEDTRLRDARLIDVGLRQHGAAMIEVWRSAGVVTHGRSGPLAWASDGQLELGRLEIDEPEGEDIAAAAEQAYALLEQHLAASERPHLLRVWNYLDAVTAGSGDDERYRRFCVGRVRGMARLDEARLPAATCIGRHDGVRRLQVYWLAGSMPGRPLENPRQVSAYRYPRQYGPQSPSFARALLPDPASGLPLLLSGTAAIVGHASQHGGSVPVQLSETLANLDSLVATARAHDAALPAVLGARSPLKVYVRREEDLPLVEAELRRQLPDDVPRVILHGEVCRAELLVEIEGMHAR